MTFKSELNSVETLFFNCFVSKKKKKKTKSLCYKGKFTTISKIFRFEMLFSSSEIVNGETMISLYHLT